MTPQSSCCCSLETIWASLFFKEEDKLQYSYSREEEKLQKVRDAYFHQDVVALSKTKKDCQQIQTKFERRFDENDDSQRYEKYGSRAHFIRDRRSAHANRRSNYATAYARQ
jgi:cupin superfamily acireductone dioxygenase involved in methionine salvage